MKQEVTVALPFLVGRAAAALAKVGGGMHSRVGAKAHAAKTAVVAGTP